MMEKKLPENWVETKLGAIVNVKSGGTPSRGVKEYWNGSIPWVKISDMSQLYINQTEEYITEEGLQNSSAKIFEKGTLLFTIFATIGKVGILNLNATTNQAIAGLIPSEFVNSIYLAHILTELSNEITSHGKGIAQKNINLSILKDTSIPLPPLAEQERIANKLDALFGQLDSLRAAMERIPGLLKDFRQQVLTQAVTGKLTEEWREGRELEDVEAHNTQNKIRKYSFTYPDNWKINSFGDIVEIACNLVNPSDYSEYPFITPDTIESMTGKILQTPIVSDINPISPKHFFDKGSIIYSKIRPYLSKVAYVDFEGLCSADMYPLRTKMNPFYLYYYMLSPIFLSYATTAGERSILPKINQKGLNIIPIPLPPLSEQAEIVRRVDSLFAQADALEQQYESLRSKVEQLPQAILHQAFTGQLVEQLPTDGHARDLLAQIEELKKAGSKKK